MERVRVPCVGGIIEDGHGRLLLVRRGREPSMGTWSIPGGRVEAGEDDQAATARELVEETGLEVVVGPFVGEVLRDAPNGDLYVIRDYRCALAPSADPVDVRAGDDAADAGWFTPAEIRSLDCAPGLVEALEQWGVLG